MYWQVYTAPRISFEQKFLWKIFWLSYKKIHQIPPKGSIVFFRPRLFEGWITLRTEQPRPQAVNFFIVPFNTLLAKTDPSSVPLENHVTHPLPFALPFTLHTLAI